MCLADTADRANAAALRLGDFHISEHRRQHRVALCRPGAPQFGHRLERTAGVDELDAVAVAHHHRRLVETVAAVNDRVRQRLAERLTRHQRLLQALHRAGRQVEAARQVVLDGCCDLPKRQQRALAHVQRRGKAALRIGHPLGADHPHIRHLRCRKQPPQRQRPTEQQHPRHRRLEYPAHAPRRQQCFEQVVVAVAQLLRLRIHQPPQSPVFGHRVGIEFVE